MTSPQPVDRHRRHEAPRVRHPRVDITVGDAGTQRFLLLEFSWRAATGRVQPVMYLERQLLH